MTPDERRQEAYDLFYGDGDGLRKFCCPHSKLSEPDSDSIAICFQCGSAIDCGPLTRRKLEAFFRNLKWR